MLPWVSETDKADLIASSIRAQVLKQTPGMPAAQQEAIIARTLGQRAAQTPDSAAGAPREGILSHEIAHIWFMRFYDRAANTSGAQPRRYGSSAPDWLDELAAVVAPLQEVARVARGKRVELLCGHSHRSLASLPLANASMRR